MANEKTLKSAEKAKKTSAAKKPAEIKAAAAAKSAAPAEKKTPARRTVSKKAAKPAVTLDDLTTAVWQKIENKNVKDIPYAIAIQVNVHDVGTFYVAVNADPEYDKQVIQADYYLADGIVEAKAEEIKKIASGNYDFIAASKVGAFTYRGDLTKGILIAELLK